MTTLTTIKQHINDVTPEQIGRCYKVFGPDNKAFYQVESENDSTVEYKVTFTKQYGFQCTCPAGQEGFAHCKHGFCKHIKWAVACAQEERAALAQLATAKTAQCDTVGCTHEATRFDTDRVQFACDLH